MRDQLASSGKLQGEGGSLTHKPSLSIPPIQVIKANDDLTAEHHQFFLYQMLRGLKYIHSGGAEGERQGAWGGRRRGGAMLREVLKYIHSGEV